jgi:hypothetical protein
MPKVYLWLQIGATRLLRPLHQERRARGHALALDRRINPGLEDE